MRICRIFIWGLKSITIQLQTSIETILRITRKRNIISFVLKCNSWPRDSLSHIGFSSLASLYPFGFFPLSCLNLKESYTIKGYTATAVMLGGVLTVNMHNGHFSDPVNNQRYLNSKNKHKYRDRLYFYIKKKNCLTLSFLGDQSFFSQIYCLFINTLRFYPHICYIPTSIVFVSASIIKSDLSGCMDAELPVPVHKPPQKYHIPTSRPLLPVLRHLRFQRFQA